MKKLLASLLAISMVFSLASCSLIGEDSSSSSSSESSSDASSGASSEGDASSADEKEEVKGYTVDVDEKIWKNITNNIGSNDSSADSADSSGTDTKNSLVNVAYSYIGDTSDPYYATANFNIIIKTGIGDAKVSDFVDVIKDEYSTLGYNISNSEEITLNGYDAYKVETTVTKSGMEMIMNQIVIAEGGVAFIISYGSESSVFEKIKPEFEKVFSTFKIS